MFLGAAQCRPISCVNSRPDGEKQKALEALLSTLAPCWDLTQKAEAQGLQVAIVPRGKRLTGEYYTIC